MGMRLIAGPDRTAMDWSVQDLDIPLCPGDTDFGDPVIYWDARLWPEVQALVEFDAERRRLHLATLTDAPEH